MSLKSNFFGLYIADGQDLVLFVYTFYGPKNHIYHFYCLIKHFRIKMDAMDDDFQPNFERLNSTMDGT